MTTQEIEDFAKEYSKCGFDQNGDIYDGYAKLSFIAGAEMVNSRQPYTAEYMASFARFVKKRWTPIDTGGWVENDKKFYLPHNVKTDEQVIKLWEEQRNG